MPQTKYKEHNKTREFVRCLCYFYENDKSFILSLDKRIEGIIKQCRECIGNDIANAGVRGQLQRAIWISTINPQTYPYEHFDLPTIARNDFYERKRKFISDIANAIRGAEN